MHSESRMAAAQPTWFCSDASREAGEPLAGTATRVDAWLLIEHPGAWERKALEGSSLPQAVKDQLAAAEKHIPHARVELIKREGRTAQGDFALFVARSAGPDTALYRFTLHTYEDLLGLDLAGIVSGDDRYEAYRDAGSLTLVCTHGRRDACCARNGLPIYRLLAGRAGASVWECSHLGGHRLGANVVVLPQGLLYGRVTPADVDSILDQDRVHLANLRGRACYDPPAQAAEIFLRAHLGFNAADGLSLAGLARADGQPWVARFTLAGETAYKVTVERVPAGYATYTSCGDATPSSVEEFRLVDII